MGHALLKLQLEAGLRTQCVLETEPERSRLRHPGECALVGHKHDADMRLVIERVTAVQAAVEDVLIRRSAPVADRRIA